MLFGVLPGGFQFFGRTVAQLAATVADRGFEIAESHGELAESAFERELRVLVLGRKNWLFAYGDLGGERAATILTIVGTCVALCPQEGEAAGSPRRGGRCRR